MSPDAFDELADGDRLQINPHTLADLVHTVGAEALHNPLPEAYLRDRIHLAFLEAVTRLFGRDPFPRLAAPDRERFYGIPIYLDASVPPDVLELRWPDGHTERVDLPPRRLPGDLSLEAVLRTRGRRVSDLTSS